MIERLETMAKGKAGAQTALAELLEVASGGAILSSEVMGAPLAAYPLSPSMKALWSAWEIAQYGPNGRPAKDGPENPPSRRPTSLRRLFGRRSAQV